MTLRSERPLDYSGWVGRLKSFLRGLLTSSGTFQVSDSIEPPTRNAGRTASLDSASSPLPESVRTFLKTASNWCAFSYQWTPSGDLPRALAPWAAYGFAVHGGGNLCEYSRYSLAYMGGNERLEKLLPPSNLFPTDQEPSEFMPILWPYQSKDRVAIRLAGDGEGKVYYLFRDNDVPPAFLADSFDDFLAAWEDMHYPEISTRTLPALLGPDGSGLDRTAPSVIALKELFQREGLFRFERPIAQATLSQAKGTGGLGATLDHAAWLTKAEQFVRSLGHLPGMFSGTVKSSSPLDEPALSDITGRLRRALPQSLVQFYTIAAADCALRFSWHPNEERLVDLREVFQNEYGVYGGVEFLSPGDLSLAIEGCSDMSQNWKDQDANPDVVAAWRQALPFCHIRNGDYLAFDGRLDIAEPPIIYLSHESPEIVRVSPSFEQFLGDWEQLCYIGPEIWMLAPWIDDDRGTLAMDRPATAQLRKLLIAAA